MPRNRSLLLWLAALLVLAGQSWGQNSVAEVLGAPGLNLADPAQRARAVSTLDGMMTLRAQAARAKAVQLGLPVRTVQTSGRILEIADFIGNEPVYFTTHNANAAISTGANLLLLPPFAVNGTGLTVAVWDGGAVRTTHQELTGRVTIKDGAAVADHATHVGGTIGAVGVDPLAKGMAPAVRLDSYEWTNDRSEMTGRGAAYPGEAGKVYLSNHSYGFISGWNYTGLSSPRWTWYGSGTTTAGLEPDFGKYETNARDTDSVAVSLPYYLIVKSAGNDRQDNPATGEPVSLTTSTTSAVSYSPATHPPGDGVYRGSGYDTISYDALAKNVLTVGSAGDAVDGGVRQPANAYMAAYSSWGPTDDGRIKPDVVANGESLTSSLSANNAAYGTSSGTSMSTPNTTGSAALLVSWWEKLFPGQVMRASTLKALLIHTADDRGTAGPDYQFGWGLINVKAAADVAQAYKNSPGTRRVIEDQLTTTTTTRSYSFTWDGSSPVRATLCWTDPAGTATTTGDLRTARLVNNLDVKINGPTGTLHQPWVMPYVGDWTVAKLSAAATKGVNTTDNVEQVHVASPSAAGVYTAVVSYTGTLTNSLQNFSLILSGGVASATAPAPLATAVTPTAGTTDTMTITLSGSGFMTGANVKLTKTGQTDVLATGQEIVGNSAKFRINVNGLASGLWNVVLTNPDGQSTTLANAFTIVGPLWQDNLETGAAGWTHSATSPYTTTNWALSTLLSSSATHSFRATGPAFKNIDDLYSPVISIPAGASNLRLTFMHYFDFQSTRDGGVLEFSINGGTWFDVTASGSGAAFATGGYNSSLAVTNPSSARNPLAGRAAWSGAKTNFSQVAVNLTDSAKYAGKTLQIRWRLATNGSTASNGWYVDDCALAGVSTANLPPSILTDATATPTPVTAMTTELAITADDDAGESALTYTWSALGGTFERPVSFSENGTNSAKTTTATFTIAGDYTFNLTVRDAQGLTATTSVDVIVEQTATSVEVTPKTATLPYGAVQAFTASVLDQFNDPLATQPTINWSASGGGTISSGGEFTATTVGGPYTITATSGVLVDTASVSVTKALAAISLSNLSQVYDGNMKWVTITTTPSNLPVITTYQGSPSLPVDFGSYAVISTINHANYEGSAQAVLNITGQPLAAWQTTYFTPSEITAGLASDAFDADDDGLANLAEYALGTNPRSATPGQTALRDANGLTLTFTRPKGLPDVAYAAESSDDLIGWDPLPLTLVTDGPTQTMRATDPLTTGEPGRRFIRLRFSR